MVMKECKLTSLKLSLARDKVKEVAEEVEF
jgi:hypothetical protein